MHIILRNVGSVTLRALPGADTGFIKGVGMEGYNWVAGNIKGESMGHDLKMLKSRN